MSKIAYPNQDNWPKFGYNLRYLDALASLLHVQTDVTAVLEENNTIYVSYNSTLTPQKNKCISLIQSLLTNISACSNDHILGIYLIFNVDFISLVKKTRNHVDEEGRKLLEKFILGQEKIYGNLDKNIDVVKKLKAEVLLENVDKYYTKQMVSNYTDILDYFTVNKELNSELNAFLRPLQDSYKLYFYLKDTNTIFNDLIVLENPNNFHADSNMAHHFPSIKYLDKNYIGVSRLACGYCHKYLEEGGIPHRGTHGVCDNKYKLPWPVKDKISPLEEKFKNSAKKIAEFDQDNQPIQYRRLSIDDFEKKIFITKEKTLWDLKKELVIPIESGTGYINPFTGGLEFKETINNTVLSYSNNNFSYDSNVLKVIGKSEDYEDDFYC